MDEFMEKLKDHIYNGECIKAKFFLDWRNHQQKKKSGWNWLMINCYFILLILRYWCILNLLLEVELSLFAENLAHDIFYNHEKGEESETIVPNPIKYAESTSLKTFYFKLNEYFQHHQ